MKLYFEGKANMEVNSKPINWLTTSNAICIYTMALAMIKYIVLTDIVPSCKIYLWWIIMPNFMKWKPQKVAKPNLSHVADTASFMSVYYPTFILVESRPLACSSHCKIILAVAWICQLLAWCLQSFHLCNLISYWSNSLWLQFVSTLRSVYREKSNKRTSIFFIACNGPALC